MPEISPNRSAVRDRPAGRMPRLQQLDSTLALMREPYRFIGEHCAIVGSDVFETRMLMAPAICMRGVEAARLFYDEARFVRHGAAPEPVRATLFGKGGVQGLDGPAHRARKALFIEATTTSRTTDLVDGVRTCWLDAVHQGRWATQVSLYDAIQPILARAVFEWMGLRLDAGDWPLRTRQLVALFDRAAGSVRDHLAARRARRDAEAWLGGIVAAVRTGRARVDPDGALARVAFHRDADGRALPLRIAAVELLNILRPTVAVSVYIVFVAHALEEAPEWRERLNLTHDRVEAAAFVDEVRRHYPFFPAVVARVRESFEWQGMHFHAGRRTFLDLYATNHDWRAWDRPLLFDPVRWLGRAPTPFHFVPQGGGVAATEHRCPGEDLTKRLMLLALELLVERMRYTVPTQRLALDLTRLPALPLDRLMIRDARLVS